VGPVIPAATTTAAAPTARDVGMRRRTWFLLAGPLPR
jgi:hypothetical protein